MFTYNEIIERIKHSAEGSLNLSYKEASIIQKILIDNGYAVMMTTGDFDDKYNIQWIYAGTPENLKTANREQITFCHSDYTEMLIFHDYKEDNE